MKQFFKNYRDMHHILMVAMMVLLQEAGANPVLTVAKDFIAQANILKDRIVNKESITLGEFLPVGLPMPEKLKSDLSQLIVQVPTIEFTPKTIVLGGKITSSMMGGKDQDLISIRFESVDHYPDDYYMSLSLQSSQQITLSAFLKELMPEIQPPTDAVDLLLIRPALIFSFGDYTAIDTVDGVIGAGVFPVGTQKGKAFKIATGVNLVAQVKLLGVAERFSQLLGNALNQVALQGLITPTIVGSSFSVSLGHVNIIPGIKGIETGGWKLTVSLGKEEEQYMPLVKLGADNLRLTNDFFQTYLPDLGVKLTEPIKVSSSIGLQPQKLQIGLGLSGKAFLPLSDLKNFLPSIEAGGDLAIDLPVDFALLGAAIPLSGIGIRWSITVGKRVIALAAKVEVSSVGVIGGLAFDGQLTGKYSAKEFVQFASHIVRNASRELGQEINLTDLADTVLPQDIAFEDLRVTLVPKTTSIGGKPYYLGILARGKIDVLGVQGQTENVVNSSGLRAFSTLSPIVLKVGGQTVLSITSATSADKGALADLSIQLPPMLYYKLDGILTLNFLGTPISSQSVVHISPTKLTADIRHTLEGLFDTELSVMSDLTNTSDIFNTSANNFYIKGKFTQTALNKLSSAMKDVANSLLPNFDVAKASEIQRANQQVQEHKNALTMWKQKEQESWSACVNAYPDWLRWSGEINCNLDPKVVEARGAIAWHQSNIVLKENVYRDLILGIGGDIVGWALGQASAAVNAAADVLQQGVNIRLVEFEGKLAEYLTKGLLPKVTIEMDILGKTITLVDVQLNLLDIPGSIKNIFDRIGAQGVLPKDIPPSRAFDPMYESFGA